MLMRDEGGRSKQGQTNKQQSKATKHTQGSHFPKKNELPQVGLEPTTLHTLDRALYQLSCTKAAQLYQGSSAQLTGPKYLTSHTARVPDEQVYYHVHAHVHYELTFALIPCAVLNPAEGNSTNLQGTCTRICTHMGIQEMRIE